VTGPARLDARQSALDAFWAIQATGGRGEVLDGGRRLGTVVDHALRAAVADGVDLAATPVAAFVDATDGPGEGGEATPPAPPIAVVQAGGRGSRLGALTLKLPKPLLSVGRTTILGRLLEGLAASGIPDVWISVNYMAGAIEERIGDGSAFGVRVEYLRESQPLGGAGPLTLLPERPAGPVLVLNADQITTLDFARMVDLHRAREAAVTVASFTHEVVVPYGVLRTEGGRLLGIDEKPTLRLPCNAGFYVIDPAMLDLVPPDRLSTMPELVDAARDRGHTIAVFPLLERWIDIGTPDELEAALLWAATGEES
jgi:NDP-sugar pyrophosphorylase family protein